jgi:O-antigen/teichoic acid export membrane protein
MPTQTIQPPARFRRIASWQLSDTVGNGIYNIVTSVLSVLGRTVLFVVGPMFLDAAHFGVYAYYSWLTGVASQLGSGGAVQAAQHFTARYSRDGAQRDFQGFLFRIGSALTILAAVIILYAPSAMPRSFVLVALAVLLAGATSIVSVEQALQQAKHDFRQPMLSEAGAQGSRVLLVFGARVAAVISAVALLLVETLSTLVKGVALFAMRRDVAVDAGAGRSLTSAEKRTVCRYLASITGIAVLNVLLWQRGEMFFLSIFATSAETAHFAAGSQLAQLLILAPTAALSSLLPKLSEKAGLNRDGFHNATNILLTASVMAALPLYCLTLLVAPLMLKVWRPEYASIGTIFPPLMLGKLALVLSAPISLALYASGRQQAVLHVVCASAAVAVATDYTLIRLYGVGGASWASAINQGVTSVATYVAGRRYLPLRLNLQPFTLCFCLIGLLAQIRLSFTHLSAVSSVGLMLVSVVIFARDPFISRLLMPSLRR